MCDCGCGVDLSLPQTSLIFLWILGTEDVLLLCQGAGTQEGKPNHSLLPSKYWKHLQSPGWGSTSVSEPEERRPRVRSATPTPVFFSQKAGFGVEAEKTHFRYGSFFFPELSGRQPVPVLNHIPEGRLYNILKGWGHKARGCWGELQCYPIVL